MDACVRVTLGPESKAYTQGPTHYMWHLAMGPALRPRLHVSREVAACQMMFLVLQSLYIRDSRDAPRELICISVECYVRLVLHGFGGGDSGYIS